jgi:hypothetical protein
MTLPTGWPGDVFGVVGVGDWHRYSGHPCHEGLMFRVFLSAGIESGSLIVRLREMVITSLER